MKILGQTRAVEILNASLQSGRFHHAWILSGPRGVGKFLAAIETARVLLDPEAPRQIQEHHPRTNIQNRIDTQTHPDLHIIRKEMAAFSESRKLRERKQLNIPIDVLRERVIGGKVEERDHEAPAYRTAMLGHGKVFIIDEAELLDPYGQSAMLKTLEEPPAETYFFLITSLPDRLLPTIRSRCQHVRFGRLNDAEMRQWLQTASETPAMPKGVELEWVLDFAEGSPGVALLAIEYGFYNWQQTLNPMLAELAGGKFPVTMGDTLSKIIEDYAQKWVTNHGKKTTSKDAANKDGGRHVISFLGTHARRQLAQHADDPDKAHVWLAGIQLLQEAQRQIESNVNMKMAMENLVVQWCHAANSRSSAFAMV